MLYKKIIRVDDRIEYRPLKSKRVLLPEVAKAIAEINMSEIQDEDKIEPDELVHAVLDEMFKILLNKIWGNLPK